MKNPITKPSEDRAMRSVYQPDIQKIDRQVRKDLGSTSAAIDWAQKFMKTNFQDALFTDEARATLDGPDGWTKVWLLLGTSHPHCIWHQQGGGGDVMFWAGIIGNKLVGSF